MANTKPTDDPLAWMLTMEMARQRGDFPAAQAAKRELDRLGVRVTYRAARRATLKAVHDAR